MDCYQQWYYPNLQSTNLHRTILKFIITCVLVYLCAIGWLIIINKYK